MAPKLESINFDGSSSSSSSTATGGGEPAAERSELPDDYGIIVRLYSESCKVYVCSVRDKGYPEIHPNVFAPADLERVYSLKGGGSGAAVFHGYHPELSDIVMKHGGAKDTKEVFSLVTVSQELLQRGATEKEDAAAYMRAKIPEFVMLYISPNHVRDRTKELWSTLRKVTLADLLNMDENQSVRSSIKLSSFNSTKKPLPSTLPLMPPRYTSSRRSSLKAIKDKKRTRRLSVARGRPHDSIQFDVNFRNLEFIVPNLQPDGSVPNGVEFLTRLSEELAEEQEMQHWKVTLGQKMIGGENAENGAYVLTSGRLKGKLLKKLVDEFTAVMRNLQHLTWPEEKSGAETLKKELIRLQTDPDVTSVSENMDAFVGSAIRKNYLPGKGRFPVLRKFGMLFRESQELLDDECLFLTKEELVPARFLGMILERGTDPSRVFAEPPSSQFALDIVENSWLSMLEHAFAADDNPSSIERIWTCGLTDAGLHNSFLSETRGLELFDLGEPHLMPLPAFLTKFLMSFFHTSGMEECKSDPSEWVNRFCVVNDRLELTLATCDRIPYLYDAFTTATDQFLEQVFNNDERVRKLLVGYVVVQLLSDASFCLQRWQSKGGGTERYGDRVGLPLDSWLWRSIWDLYIASHVYDRLLLE